MAKGKRNVKRNNAKKIEEVNSSFDLSNTLYIIAGILLFIFAFYILTLYITNKNSEDTNEDTTDTVEVSSEKIMVGSILSMGDGEYFVLCYDFNNPSDFDNLYTTASSTGKTIYKVDLSSAFNKKYITDSESNKNPTKESEFKINGPTLIKVANKEVVEYIEGEEAITNYLN